MRSFCSQILNITNKIDFNNNGDDIQMFSGRELIGDALTVDGQRIVRSELSRFGVSRS
jgi:hypothetical protein